MFTINNPSRVDLPKDWESVAVYCVWQLEEGEEGTRHLQGYAIFPNPLRLSGCKKHHCGAHWEPRRGNHSQAKAYCTKLDTRIEGPFEYGQEPLGQGKRSDLDGLKELIDGGCDESELWESNFTAMVKYTRGIREYKRLRTPARSWKTEVHIAWGCTNIGKSHWARESAPDAFWKRYTKGGGEWWDGYDGEEDVVIDEFYGWMQWNFILQLFDEYPLSVDTKGGAVQFVARRIFVTSNAHPRDWYNWRGHMEYRTLARRITSIRTRDSVDDEWQLESGDAIPARNVDPPGTSRASTYRPIVIDLSME